ncbi:MAG: hypothetical protein U0694_04490 [Anaerolineae bacterium]
MTINYQLSTTNYRRSHDHPLTAASPLTDYNLPMIRYWLLIASTLILGSLLLSAVALALGSLSANHPALAGFSQCDGQLCWMGIDIQQTTPHQAARILLAAGFTTSDDINFLPQPDTGRCDMVLGGGGVNNLSRISSLQLLNCGSLTFGDVWSILGTPELVANDCFDNWVLWYDNSLAVFVSGALLPQNRVTQISFYPLSEFGISPYGVPWHGFATQWRYNQLEGNLRGC